MSEGDQDGHDTPGSSPTFWEHLQVFPEAIADAGTKGSYSKRAYDTLMKLRVGNLRYICDCLNVGYSPLKDLPQELVSNLMESEWAERLTYLAAFFRPRVNAVVEYFDKYVPAAEARRLDLLVKEKANRSNETLKPFTKLVFIYLRKQADLQTIHYIFSWRRVPSYHEYEAEISLPTDSIQRLNDSIEKLVKSLDGTNQGQSFDFFGSAAIKGGFEVFLLHRNYHASVKPDHKKLFRLQHDYGRVVFGLNRSNSRLVIKVQNRAIRSAIRDWVSGVLDVKFLVAGGEWFAGYDGASVANRILGGYDDKAGLDLLGVSFKYSSLPGGGPISLTAPEFGRSVKDELQFLRKQGAIKLNSLTDLQSLSVRYSGTITTVSVEAVKGGAVQFRIDDSGLDEAYIEGMKDAFLDAFSLPLNQPINPAMMLLGTTEIYHFLLSGVYHSQLRRHHLDHLKVLLEQGVLKEVDIRTGACSELHCSKFDQKLKDPEGSDCAACGQPLTLESRKRYLPEEKKISSKIRRLLQRATGWELSKTARKFESYTFYQLKMPDNPKKFVYVFVNDRVTEVKIEIFRRSMFPILVVHPAGSHRLPVIDFSGIGHLDFPYAFAAQSDAEAKKRFRLGCKETLERLLMMEQERILSSSRHSRDSLGEKGLDYNDRMFETDIYNVLRRFFLYSMKLGGPNKPDGFVSIISYDKNELAKPVKHNFSYDAKYSEDHYDFGVHENRQMLDYIMTFSRSKWLQAEGNTYNGHIIITNSMKEQAMKNSADYLWTGHRLASERPDFLVVFMREQFLTKLYDRIHGDFAEIAQRWLMFPEVVVNAIKAKRRDGYSLLDEAEADEIISHLLDLPAIDSPVNQELLLKEVTYMISQKTNNQTPAPKPSTN